LLEHDLFRKPVSTFRDHALGASHRSIASLCRRHAAQDAEADSTPSTISSPGKQRMLPWLRGARLRSASGEADSEPR
jgi:hypothetical protein